MNEHLFKLKKDGKTVGYLKLADGWTQFQRIGRDDWYFPCDVKWTSAHPFVTKDKNDKDVFADDIVSHDRSEFTHRVTWNKARLEYVLLHPTTSAPTWSLGFCKDREQKDIELIEEKEND